MTENKGDLISREALKEEVENLIGYSLSYEAILNAIDNAPTVEVIPTELHEKIMDKTTGELLECQSNLRPQGEWIEVEPTEEDKEYGFDIRIVCSRCYEPDSHFDYDEYHKPKAVWYFRPNFCPNCGADMRPKPNQLRDCENCIHHSDNGCEVWECEFKRRSS